MAFEQRDNMDDDNHDILEEDYDLLDEAEELSPPKESRGAKKSQRKHVNESQENGKK